MHLPAWLALSNSAKELLLVVFIVLIPTVPVTFFAWTLLGKRRGPQGEGMEHELEAGRSPATPFAMISIVGSVIAVTAMLVLLLVVGVRAIAG
jgi:hypothetical protein